MPIKLTLRDVAHVIEERERETEGVGIVKLAYKSHNEAQNKYLCKLVKLRKEMGIGILSKKQKG